MIGDFCCNSCKSIFEELTSYDETGEYPSVICPQCGSLDKKRVPSTFAFNFTNPEGTSRWNHDYKYKTNIPKVQAERALAEAASHMGTNPYNNKHDTNKYDAGIHDAK